MSTPSSFFGSLLLTCAATTSLQAQLFHTDEFGDGVADGWREEDLNDPSFGPGIFEAVFVLR